MDKIQIVGLGPGARNYILPVVIEKIESADLLIGSKRSLALFSHKNCFYYENNLPDMIKTINDKRSTNKICVVVTGDTGFYSLLDYLKRYFEENDIEVTPGISSFQYMFSKLKRSYKAFKLMSLHGREEKMEEVLKESKKVFFLTDQTNSPRWVARKLSEKGYGQCYMAVGENLSYDDEVIEEGLVNDFLGWNRGNLSVVVIDLEME